MSLPSKMIVPAEITPGRSSSRINALPRVDLPLPDSPTSPTISPGSMAKVTPRTAWVGARFLVA